MRIIIYSVGTSHQLYFNLTDEEAERRWNDQRANRSMLEDMHEKKMGWTVQREVLDDIKDELFIWGNMGDEVQAITQDLFSLMADNPYPKDTNSR